MRRMLAACAVLTLCLTACSGGGDDPTPSPTTSTTSGTPTTTGPTSTDPPDGPPELPDAAKAQTTAGAKAFVSYYVAVLNYSFAKLDASQLQRLASTRCDVCRLLEDSVRSMARRGGSQDGGSWRVVTLAQSGGTDSARKMIARIHIKSGSITRSKTSRPEKLPERTVYDEFTVRWNGRWLVEDVRSA